jgi:hypothetical protein
MTDMNGTSWNVPSVQVDAVNCGIITTVSCIYLAMGLVPLYDYPNACLQNGGIPTATADTWRAWARVVIATDGSFMGHPPKSSTDGGGADSQILVRTLAPCPPRFLVDHYGAKAAAKTSERSVLPEAGKTGAVKAGKKPKNK